MASEPSPGRKVLHAFNVGQVKRWHVVGHTVRPQDVAQHSYGVAVIITLLHPDPSAALLKAALTHDWGELVAGDLPRWVKERNPDVAQQLEILEEGNRQKFGVEYTALLSKEEIGWLRGADLLDAWLFALQNVIMQNHYMHGSLNKATRAMRDLVKAGDVPIELAIAMEQMLSAYPWVKTW